MDTVTVLPKFQIVIPRAIRQALDIKPGQRVQAIRYGDRIELIPLRSMNSARGFLSGINSDIASEQRPPVNVVDSSGWLEYFADGPNAKAFAASQSDVEPLVVPLKHSRIARQRSVWQERRWFLNQKFGYSAAW